MRSFPRQNDVRPGAGCVPPATPSRLRPPQSGALPAHVRGRLPVRRLPILLRSRQPYKLLICQVADQAPFSNREPDLEKFLFTDRFRRASTEFRASRNAAFSYRRPLGMRPPDRDFKSRSGPPFENGTVLDTMTGTAGGRRIALGDDWMKRPRLSLAKRLPASSSATSQIATSHQNGQTIMIIGTATAMTMISSGRPMRQ